MAPRVPNVALLVEVTDSSLDEDRTIKGPLYAEAEFPIYWIVNLHTGTVEVYTDPSGPQAVPEYRHRQDYGLNEAVPLLLDAQEVGRIPVRDLLP